MFKFSRASLSKTSKTWLHAARFGSKRSAVQADENRTVNAPYRGSSRPFPAFDPKDNSAGVVSDEHFGTAWTPEQVDESIDKHCLMAWGASKPMKASALPLVRGEGSFLIDANGKRYFDMSSQAMCSNLGHTMPADVEEAIIEQMRALPMVYGGIGTVPIRGQLCSLLAQLFPGDINAFLFPSSGAEANEGAIRIARKFTGKTKILNRYRSYHGGTLGALTATGDIRRADVDTTTTGFVKITDPFPQFFSWDDDDTNMDLRIERSLDALHEQILNEGPHTCAAIMVESITGTNGWLRTPPEFLQGLRALCDRYDMLLIVDEVMAGWGRTGKWFGFQHAPGVIPDVVTFAKGVTAAYLPLSGIGVRSQILEHFGDTPIGYGSTYQAHPISLACGYAVVTHLLENDLVARSADMESVLSGMMQEKLLDRHPRVKSCRVTGMAGCVDIGDESGENFICGINETHPDMAKLKKNLNDEGVSTMMRGHLIHMCPPLNSAVSDIDNAIEGLSRALTSTFG